MGGPASSLQVTPKPSQQQLLCQTARHDPSSSSLRKGCGAAGFRSVLAAVPARNLFPDVSVSAGKRHKCPADAGADRPPPIRGWRRPADRRAHHCPGASPGRADRQQERARSAELLGVGRCQAARPTPCRPSSTPVVLTLSERPPARRPHRAGGSQRAREEQGTTRRRNPGTAAILGPPCDTTTLSA